MRIIKQIREKLRVLPIKKPVRLIIEPSSKCNFMCPRCLYPVMKREKEFIDLTALEKFIRSLQSDFGSFHDV